MEKKNLFGSVFFKSTPKMSHQYKKKKFSPQSKLTNTKKKKNYLKIKKKKLIIRREMLL